jgi:hypothetical protein
VINTQTAVNVNTDNTCHVHPVTDTNSAFRMNMSSANTYSSIVDNLVNNADWFFPGGKCKLCLVD